MGEATRQEEPMIPTHNNHTKNFVVHATQCEKTLLTEVIKFREFAAMLKNKVSNNKPIRETKVEKYYKKMIRNRLKNCETCRSLAQHVLTSVIWEVCFGTPNTKQRDQKKI